MEDEEIIRILDEVRGIGPWTVQMLLIFTLGRTDVFPVDDLGVKKGVQGVYSLAELPKGRDGESSRESWHPYRTVASLYLWRHKDTKGGVRGLARENYKGYPDPSRIVSVEEASKLVGRKDVVFVDTRNYWKYAKGHVPGAVNLELYAFHWFDTSKEGLEVFAGEMARLFGAYGIDEQEAGRVLSEQQRIRRRRGVWLLEFLGNRRGRMLDGGLNTWKRSGLRLSKADPDILRARFASKPNLGVVCGMEELAGSLGRGGLSLVDARAPGEYGGTYRRALKGGHVPGAMNVEWKTGAAQGRDAQGREAARGAVRRTAREEQVVTYCQSGYRAAHSWLVLRLLGYGVRETTSAHGTSGATAPPRPSRSSVNIFHMASADAACDKG